MWVHPPKDVMRIPTMQGLIDRRILVNFRVDPDRVAKLLPAPFRPKLIHGHAMAGICLIRLKQLRPAVIPLPLGIGSENAAHRFAVTWERDGAEHEGVFIPRRDTNSRLNTFAGGRLFPGVHHHAAFHVVESDTHLEIGIESDDGRTRVHVAGHVADALPAASIFSNLEEASRFFQNGALGYSPQRTVGRYEGLQLQCEDWSIRPFEVERVTSSYFEDKTLFPDATATFDCALLMRGIRHRWQSREPMCC
jgi:hypothetical protein